MAVGLSATYAEALLDNLRNIAVTGKTVYVQLHTDANTSAGPGAAGTANVSAVTTRNAVTFNAASSTNGTMTLSSLPSFSMTASETIKFISLWDASSAGNFLQSAQLTSAVPVINGSTLTFSSLTLSYSPIAS